MRRFWGPDDEDTARCLNACSASEEREHLRQEIWPKVSSISHYACRQWGGYVKPLGLSIADLHGDLVVHLFNRLETRFSPEKGTAYGFLVKCAQNFVTNWVEPRYARPRLFRHVEVSTQIDLTDRLQSPLDHLLACEEKSGVSKSVQLLRERLSSVGQEELAQILAGFEATEDLTGWERSRRFREFIPKDRYTYFLKKSRKCLDASSGVTL